jgi:hypothetical protein
MDIFRHKAAKTALKLKYTLAWIPFVAELWLWLRWR